VFVQLSELEEELNNTWKEKCDRLLSSAEERHHRALAEVTTDKNATEEKVRLLETKVCLIELSSAGCELAELVIIQLAKMSACRSVNESVGNHNHSMQRLAD